MQAVHTKKSVPNADVGAQGAGRGSLPGCLMGNGDGDRREKYGETLGEGPGPAGPPAAWGGALLCCPEAPAACAEAP